MRVLLLVTFTLLLVFPVGFALANDISAQTDTIVKVPGEDDEDEGEEPPDNGGEDNNEDNGQTTPPPTQFICISYRAVIDAKSHYYNTTIEGVLSKHRVLLAKFKDTLVIFNLLDKDVQSFAVNINKYEDDIMRVEELKNIWIS